MSEEQQGYSVKHQGDRRQRPTPFISRYTFWGRRRTSPGQQDYYVDRLGGKVWGIIALVIILSLIDSVFTIYFLTRGFQEINPLMNIAIFVSKPFFIIFKGVLTIMGILIIGLHKNFRYVKILMTIIIAMYTFLNCYHLYLFLR